MQSTSIDPEELRADLDNHQGQPGVVNLRRLLDEATFVLTDTELERRFFRIAKQAGLPKPLTQQPSKLETVGVTRRIRLPA